MLLFEISSRLGYDILTTQSRSRLRAALCVVTSSKTWDVLRRGIEDLASIFWSEANRKSARCTETVGFDTRTRDPREVTKRNFSRIQFGTQARLWRACVYSRAQARGIF